MGVQILISDEEMSKAGFAGVSELVHEGYLCPDCGGLNPRCDYCAGNGDGISQYRTVYVKGDIRLPSYADDAFCADCNSWGSNRDYFASLGLLELEHRFI